MVPDANINEIAVLRQAQAMRAEYLRSLIARLFRRADASAAARQPGIGATA